MIFKNINNYYFQLEINRIIPFYYEVYNYIKIYHNINFCEEVRINSKRFVKDELEEGEGLYIQNFY